MSEEQEEPKQEENLSRGCGQEPLRQGSNKPGFWDCQGSSWVWIEDIGGG